MVENLLGAVLVTFLILLAWGGLTGRVRGQGCCCPPDPEDDLRMKLAEDGSRGTGTE